MLQPAQFPEHLYHGTNVELKPGDKVLPSDATGNSLHGNVIMNRGQRNGAYAFAADSEEKAWQYAGTASKRGGGRGAVYKVTAHPDMEPDTNHDYGWRSPQFTVVDDIHTKPPSLWDKYSHDTRQVQGTIPGQDWSIAEKNPHYKESANHPEPEDAPMTPSESIREENRSRSWNLRNRDFSYNYDKPQPGQQALFSSARIPLKQA